MKLSGDPNSVEVRELVYDTERIVVSRIVVRTPQSMKLLYTKLTDNFADRLVYCDQTVHCGKDEKHKIGSEPYIVLHLGSLAGNCSKGQGYEWDCYLAVRQRFSNTPMTVIT